jgi:drug/metabolite transporter (DMT)-like permease
MNRILRILPILAVLAGATFGASSGLYIKSIHLSSLALTGFRMGIPLLFMIPVMIRGKRLLGDPSRRKMLWLVSGMNAIRMLLFVMAYKFTTVGNAVVLLYLWPVFAMVFDAVRLRHRPKPSQIGLVALSFTGVIVMNLHRGLSISPGDLYGSMLMIVSSSMFAVTAILFKDALATMHETDALYFQNAVGALVFLPFLLAELPFAPPIDIVLGLLYGLTVGLVGFGFFFIAMKRLPLFQYGALAYSEVPIAVLLGVFVLGERLVANQFAGALMVITASFLAQRMRSANMGDRGGGR